MYKILLLGFLLVFGFSSCQNDDDGLSAGERPDERLNETLSEYKFNLVNAQYGWKAVLYPAGGAAYSFYFIFTDNDRVTMYSDIDATTASIAMESTYRLKAMQRPSLLFDTYSYIHILSDPDPIRSGGIAGEGKISDFEFAFDSVTDNTIELIGNFNGSVLLMEEATQEEAANYIPEIANNVSTFENINNFNTYFKRFTLGNNEYDISINTNYRQISFSYYESNRVNTFFSDYYFTREGLALITPFENAGITISNLNDLQYDSQTSSITFSVEGVTGKIQSASQPIAIDVQAARQFYGNPANGLYWVTENGFTIEGVPDALGVGAMENFAFSVFWPQFGESEGTTYDLFGFIVETPDGLSISSGPAFVPEFPNDGRLIFNFIGTLGEVSPEDEEVFLATTEIFSDPEGFYVIQTSAASYDLVSANDATKWISFF